MNRMAHVSTAEEFSVATVAIAADGRAKVVQSKRYRLLISAQAEHIGYLSVGDAVVVVHASSQNIILAKLSHAEQNPAFLLERINENTVGGRFGESAIYMHKGGGFEFENKNIKLSLSESGEYRLSAIRYDMTSTNNIILKTLSGSIYCYYPEV